MCGCSLMPWDDAGSQVLPGTLGHSQPHPLQLQPFHREQCPVCFQSQPSRSWTRQPAGLAWPPTSAYPDSLSPALICPFPAQPLPVEPAALGSAQSGTQLHGHTLSVTIQNVELCVGCWVCQQEHTNTPANTHTHTHTYTLSDLFASFKSL